MSNRTTDVAPANIEGLDWPRGYVYLPPDRFDINCFAIRQAESGNVYAILKLTPGNKHLLVSLTMGSLLILGQTDRQISFLTSSEIIKQ